jgi:hypothetical protein
MGQVRIRLRQLKLAIVPFRRTHCILALPQAKSTRHKLAVPRAVEDGKIFDLPRLYLGDRGLQALDNKGMPLIRVHPGERKEAVVEQAKNLPQNYGNEIRVAAISKNVRAYAGSKGLPRDARRTRLAMAAQHILPSTAVTVSASAISLITWLNPTPFIAHCVLDLWVHRWRSQANPHPRDCRLDRRTGLLRSRVDRARQPCHRRPSHASRRPSCWAFPAFPAFGSIISPALNNASCAQRHPRRSSRVRARGRKPPRFRGRHDPRKDHRIANLQF